MEGWAPSARRGEDGQFLTLVPTRGPAYVKVQGVDGPPGVHLDLDSTDRARAVAAATAPPPAATALGARPAWRYHDVEVMRSPGGLAFCHTLVDGSPRLVRTGTTVIDQVCVDVPAEHWDRDTAFWRDLTGRRLEPGRGPFAFLPSDGQVRILLQRLDEASGPVRAHPDLASADRAADTRRHRDLGARLVATHPRWTVLTAPGGQVYCLTDRDPATGELRA